MNQSVVNHQRRLGAIMLELELLRPEQIEPILRAQREFNLPFGAAAVRLGLLTEDQLEQALYSQFDYPYLTRGTGGFSSQLVAA